MSKSHTSGGRKLRGRLDKAATAGKSIIPLGTRQAMWIDSNTMKERNEVHRHVGRKLSFLCCNLFLLLVSTPLAMAAIGDPQIRTDHPWYPGELACSTFGRLRDTQAEQYQRATGIEPKSDQEMALAAWFWRNTHYAHGEEGAEDLWGTGFTKGDLRTREYWTGLFAHGFGLCGTTHSQWTAEMEFLFGHGRGRGVGVDGHNSFEVFLTGGGYGTGKWALMDHDISTVIFNADGDRLLSIPEVKPDVKRLTDRKFSPEKQNGWLVCGLHPDDGGVYRQYTTAEYLAGYAGAPPMVHLRRGETLRRYLQPGLEDGKTFVFWGRNYNTAGVPGPERSHTWVNQPEAMHGSHDGAGYKPGQVRYANAVYTYRPDFKNGDYREGIIDESGAQVTFEFYTPYIIGATPSNNQPWGIYDSGGRNGLVLRGKADCAVSLSVDQGRTWQDCGTFKDGLDLTDFVKGRRQYFIRFGAGAKALAGSGLTMTTVCQANAAMLPRLKDDGTRVMFAASQRAIVSAGPNREQAKTHIVAGAFETPTVTLEVAPPRGETIAAIHSVAHLASGNPPSTNTRYQIEFSTDHGQNWKPMVQDWTIPRRGEEPGDFWSQSFCYGSTEIAESAAPSVQVRFKNNGGKKYLRAEAHLVYRTAATDATQVTFDWIDGNGTHRESHLFTEKNNGTWDLKTGRRVQTRWVEFAVAPR